MLSEQVAIVTGSSKGIGRAIAVEFAANGADVVVNYHTDERGARDTAADVRAHGGEAAVVGADVADPDQAADLVETAVTDLDGLDILVNNAGVYPRVTWDELNWENWSETMDANVGGTVNVTKAALQHLLEADPGVVLNMTSMWADRGGTPNVPYPASKGAIKSLTRQLAAEFAADGLRANAISPGIITTAMNAEQREDPAYVETMEAMVPQGRLGDADEVADAAVFLAGDAASYINGVTLPVDGGLLAG